MNAYILEFFNEVLPDIMSGPPLCEDESKEDAVNGGGAQPSMVGEAEVGDITAW